MRYLPGMLCHRAPCRILQVQVRQERSNPASTVEVAINLGCNPLTLQEIKLSTKQQIKRLKRKKKPGQDPGDSADDEPNTLAEGAIPSSSGFHHQTYPPEDPPYFLIRMAFQQSIRSLSVSAGCSTTIVRKLCASLQP